MNVNKIEEIKARCENVITAGLLDGDPYDDVKEYIEALESALAESQKELFNMSYVKALAAQLATELETAKSKTPTVDEFWGRVVSDMTDLVKNRQEKIDILTATLDHYERAAKENWLVYLPEPRKPLVWGDSDHNTILCPKCGKDLMGGFPDDICNDFEDIFQCFYCGQPIDGSKVIKFEEWQAAKAALLKEREPQ